MNMLFVIIHSIININIVRSATKANHMTSIGLNIRIPKDSIIKLHEHENKKLVVKFVGGR